MPAAESRVFNPHGYRVKEVSSDTWWLRLFLFLYPVKRSEVSFCKLFWGYLLIVPWSLVMGVFFAFTVPILAIHDWLSEATAERRTKKMRKSEKYMQTAEYWREKEAREKARKERDAKWRARRAAFLDWWGVFADRWVGRVQFVWRFIKYPVLILSGVAVGIAVGTGLYFFIKLLLIAPWNIVGIVIATIFAILVIAWVLSRLIRMAPVQTTTYIVGGKVAKGGMSFGSMMFEGYYAIKTRTCPLIKVVDN